MIVLILVILILAAAEVGMTVRLRGIARQCNWRYGVVESGRSCGLSESGDHMGIVEFLEARIAEDEAVAKAALHHPRTYNKATQDFDQTGTDNGSWHTSSFCDPSDQRMVEGVGITIYDEGGHTAEQADHIARHDPARILREVAAKRRLVELYGSLSAQWAPNVDYGFAQTTLRTLAAIYSDHPDYNEEWRP